MIIDKNNKTYKVPDFMIVGAAKCGTTSIANYLSQHSKIFVPNVKECRFFSEMTPNFKGPGDYVVNQEMVTNIDDYSNLFDNASEGSHLCDASVDYLYYYENTIKKIKEIYPKGEYPKIIISLRNPSNRTFSMYSHLRRDLRETLSLNEAINAEKTRENDNWEWVWQYTKASKYYQQVKYFYENYDRDKIKVIIYEDFVKDINQGIEDILSFLDLPSQTIDTNTVYNKSGEAKSIFLQKMIVNKGPLMRGVKKLFPQKIKDYFVNKNIESVKITEDQKLFLNEFFKDDIKDLEKLLERDLTVWL